MADMLATPADLASLLQRDVDTASATLAIEIATSVVQTAAGGQRIVQVVDDTAVIDLDVDPGHYLRLPQWPVTAVKSASIGATAVTDFTAQLSRGQLWRECGWRSTTWSWGAVYYACDRTPSTATVVYTHGYPAGDQGLQLARGLTLSLARGLFTNPDGTIREQIDDYQVAYADAAGSLAATPSMSGLLRKQYGRKAAMVRVL